MCLVFRTGNLSKLVKERLPHLDAMRYYIGSIAKDRGWSPELTQSIKDILTSGPSEFRRDVTQALIEELVRNGPRLLDLDLIAHGVNAQGDPVSACGCISALVRSPRSTVFRNAVRQVIRATKDVGGLYDGGRENPDRGKNDGEDAEEIADSSLEADASLRPLWRGQIIDSEPRLDSLSEEEDSSVDDVCDALKHQSHESGMHLSAILVTTLMSTPPICPNVSEEIYALVQQREGQKSVREALRDLAGDPYANPGEVDVTTLRRMFRRWNSSDVRKILSHDGSLDVIRILVSAAATRTRALRDCEARACAPDLIQTLRGKLSPRELPAFDQSISDWSDSKLARFGIAVNSAAHEPRDARQRERSLKNPLHKLAAEAGVGVETLYEASYEVMVRRMLASETELLTNA